MPRSAAGNGFGVHHAVTVSIIERRIHFGKLTGKRAGTDSFGGPPLGIVEVGSGDRWSVAAREAG
jgi:hypothetical protein